MALTPQQTKIAGVVYSLAFNALKKAGVPNAASRAREMVAAAWAETGGTLDPTIRNKAGSGAAGLFQLLSSGYVNKANSLGGVDNPRANTLAILPNYVSYWKKNPNAPVGAGATSVEASGMGNDFYSAPLSGPLAGYQPGPSIPPENSPKPPGAIPSSGIGAGIDTHALALQGLQTLASGGHYDALKALGELAQAKRVAQSAPQQNVTQTPQSPQVGLGASTGALAPGEWSQWVNQSPTMDRQGVTTKPGVLMFVAKIAQMVGSPLTIGTGTNHNEFVKGTKRQSDHWFGDAADIPASGAGLIRIGQASLIAAGMPPAEAHKQTGGVFNVGGYNILFNTDVGGNHYNHLHVGLGRILGRD